MARIAPTPKHLWVIGIIALLWNCVGAFDYLMTETRNAAYMAQFSQEQLDYFYGFPAWVVAFWALAVWSGVLGGILLLLRRRLAAPVFLVSLVAMVVTAVHNYGISDALSVAGVGGLVFSVVIFVISLGLWLYARAQAARGVLG
ncbi:MAG: hypothetical protein R3D98_06305 [Candidatus Krumholzibacteriia bacterium]